MLFSGSFFLSHCLVAFFLICSLCLISFFCFLRILCLSFDVLPEQAGAGADGTSALTPLELLKQKVEEQKKAAGETIEETNTSKETTASTPAPAPAVVGIALSGSSRRDSPKGKMGAAPASIAKGIGPPRSRTDITFAFCVWLACLLCIMPPSGRWHTIPPTVPFATPPFHFFIFVFVLSVSLSLPFSLCFGCVVYFVDVLSVAVRNGAYLSVTAEETKKEEKEESFAVTASGEESIAAGETEKKKVEYKLTFNSVGEAKEVTTSDWSFVVLICLDGSKLLIIFMCVCGMDIYIMMGI